MVKLDAIQVSVCSFAIIVIILHNVFLFYNTDADKAKTVFQMLYKDIQTIPYIVCNMTFLGHLRSINAFLLC